ncbi:MAG: PDZ domain-containing protein [Cyanobacteria bacterium J055]|nr:MAG: PDZ domain-containing protein [Cyanobacteria bacterium J055]
MNCQTKSFRWSQVAVLAGAVVTTTALSLLSPFESRSANAALESSPKTVLDEAWQIVYRDYVDGTFNQVDWQEVRQELLSRDYSFPQQAYTALRQALSRLDDPYTRFLDPEQFLALTNQTAGELSGIGLQLTQDDGTRNIVVSEPIPNSPATRAGLQAGDRLLEIDGRDTVGMSVEQAASLIRGEVGTSIVLKIDRPSEDPFEVTLVRSRIELPAVHHSVKQEGNTRVGYIELKEFSAHAAEQMYRAIGDLNSQNVEAFVLDLRGNPGGLLNVSVEIARMWMDRGAIVRTVDRRGHTEELNATGMSLSEKPLAVLVDGDSASASEILAGALQDNQRATIIGTQTFGKALVQAVNSLSDGSGLAVTIAHYYTPNGTDINKTGITPDIVLDDLNGKQRLSFNPELRGTLSDPYYSRAVGILQTQTRLAAN